MDQVSTIDDVISLYLAKSIPEVGEYFGRGQSWGYENNIVLKKIPEKNCGLLVLLYCLATINERNTMPINVMPSGLAKARMVFHPDFLGQCWTRACDRGLEHDKLGNIIKSLGYNIQVSTKKFEDGYKMRARLGDVDGLTVDDIIYLFITDNPLIRVNIPDSDLYNYEICSYMAPTYKFKVRKYKKENFDKIALVNCAAYAVRDYDVWFSGKYCSYNISKEFLAQCWSRVCEFGLEHHRVGNILKKLMIE